MAVVPVRMPPSPGGPSGGCIPEALFDLPIDFERLREASAMMGSGGLIVMDDHTCMVDVAKYFLGFLADESCGKCTPCREGVYQMHRILCRITEGQGREGDIELLERLGRHVKSSSLCQLGGTATNPVVSTLRYFRDEYEAHIRHKSCPAGVCKALVTFEIEAQACKGCTLCARNCPSSAIAGEKKQPHTIDAAKCVKCGVCYEECPFDRDRCQIFFLQLSRRWGCRRARALRIRETAYVFSDGSGDRHDGSLGCDGGLLRRSLG